MMRKLSLLSLLVAVALGFASPGSAANIVITATETAPNGYDLSFNSDTLIFSMNFGVRHDATWAFACDESTSPLCSAMPAGVARMDQPGTFNSEMLGLPAGSLILIPQGGVSFNDMGPIGTDLLIGRLTTTQALVAGDLFVEGIAAVLGTLGRDADANALVDSDFSFAIASIPEPNTLVLLGAGLACLAFLRRRSA
jgi:hypothetical protein